MHCGLSMSQALGKALYHRYLLFNPWHTSIFKPLFTDGEIKAQRGKTLCPRLHG